MKKRVFRLTESQLKRLSKRFLNESYGLITYQDTICEIICKEKVAKYGSRGDVVQMIQHLLYANRYNTKYAGGGMKGDFCYKDFRECDGIFKEHTKNAVEDFQRDAGINVDGVVGYETWKAMCSKLTFTKSLPKDKFCNECPCDDFQDDFKDDFKDIDDFNPIKEIDTIDCEKLKKCVKDHILKPVPDYTGFEKCIGGGQKDNRDLKDNINLDKEGFIEGCTWFIRTDDTTLGYKPITKCPKYLNCMPGPNKDMTYCNSKAIKACVDAKCTSITY